MTLHAFPLRATVRASLLATALLGMAGAAQADLFRAYLSADGNDANPCTLPAPCRLLPAALNAVAAGGEIWMLDSANYNTGNVTIGKSVTILAVPGVVGSVVANGGHALNVAAPDGRVTLRNLHVVPVPGMSGAGIYVAEAKRVSIESSVVAGLAQGGVIVGGVTHVSISDSVIRDNTGAGVQFLGGGQGVITRTVITGNKEDGVSVMADSAGRSRVTVANSIIERNIKSGIQVSVMNGATGTSVSVTASRLARNLHGIAANGAVGFVDVMAHGNTIVDNNGQGISASGTAVRMFATQNTVSGNAIGIVRMLGEFHTSQDNFVNGNNQESSGTFGFAPPL